MAKKHTILKAPAKKQKQRQQLRRLIKFLELGIRAIMIHIIKTWKDIKHTDTLTRQFAVLEIKNIQYITYPG